MMLFEFSPAQTWADGPANVHFDSRQTGPGLG